MNEREIFLSALEYHTLAERAEFLDRACGHDAALRGRLDGLLSANEQAGGILDALAGLGQRPVGPTEISGHNPAEDDLDLTFLAPCDTPGRMGRLGPYEIIDVIGRGGMGVVLKAHDVKLQRIVAVKVLAAQLAANKGAGKRFQKEAQNAAAVGHDNIVTIHAVDEAQGVPFLVMEYIVGQSLQQRIDRQGPLELTEILRIGGQIAEGLAAAHKQGLVHRDIKPANILLQNGIQRVKITDFGLARAVDDVGLTQTGHIAGTPHYMSPEQAQGETVDHRSDLFSLGSVLYTMCTGRPAFRAENTVAVLRRVCDDTPRPIREVNPEIPEWLEAIIDKLLAKRPMDRFATAQEVGELLGQHLAHMQQPLRTPQPAPIARPDVVAGPPLPVRQSEAAAPDRLSVLRGPAFGLIGTACFNVLVVMGMAIAAAVNSRGQFGIGPAEIVIILLMILPGSAVIMMGGLRMLQGESYGLCLVASVMAIVVGPGYLLGWPMGLWALVVLSRPGVRELFRTHATRTIRAERKTPRSAIRSWTRRHWLTPAILTAVGAAYVYWYGLNLVLTAENEAIVRVDFGDELAHLVLRRDGRTLTAPSRGYLRIVPGTYHMQVIAPPGKRVDAVSFYHQTLFTGRHQPNTGNAARELYIGRGDIVKIGARLSPDEKPATATPGTHSSHEVPWQPLFNGRDLTGWKTHPHQPGEWKVEDGVLVGSGAVSHLFTERNDFHDFEFRGEIRLNENGNSGVFLRTPFALVDPNQSPTNPIGYEVQLVEGNQLDPKQQYLSGGLIPIANPVSSNLIHAGQWFKFRVLAVGDRFEVWIDDVQTVSTTDPTAQRFRGGHLALQVWTPQTRAEFRNLEVRTASIATTAQPLVDFTGDWNSGWGPVTLNHAKPVGDRPFELKGFYFNGKGAIIGQVDPRTRTFRGVFREPNGNGRLQMVLSADGTTIDGGFDFLDEPLEQVPPRQPWRMTRQPPEAAVTSSDAGQATLPEPARVDARPVIAPLDAATVQRYQAAFAENLRVPLEWTNPLGMQFRLLPPGEFAMGSTTEETNQLTRALEQAGAGEFDKSVAQTSGPQHLVRITRPFYCGMYEVTVGEYRQFVEATKYLSSRQQLGVKRFEWTSSIAEPNAERRAVIGVSWDDAQAFCQWRSKQDGVTYELPTEAQWEYACRAGTTTLWSFGDDPSQLHEYAVFGRESIWPAEVVGTKRPNPFGLYDLHGNADEWCRDWHKREFYANSPVNDPVCLDNPQDKNSGRVSRGGTSASAAWWTRSTTRPWDFPATPNTAKGFRVVVRIDDPAKFVDVNAPISALQPANGP